MNSNTLTESGTRAGRREWIGLAVLALPTLLLSIDMSVLYLALPHLAADLQPSSSQLLWTMDIYGFMVAGFLVTMGTLGDRIGRRRLLLIGASAFTVASVLAAYSNSPEMLIASRTALGIAGATLMPSTLALISNMFQDPKQRGSAIAVWISCFMGGTALGPVVGGVMLQWFWWGSVFLLGVPVMVLLLATGPVLLPEYRDRSAGRLDLTSVFLSLATILPIIYGLKEIAKADGYVVPIASIAIGAAVGVVFVRRQLRLSDPLLDLGLFRNRSFRTALITMLVSAFFIGGLFFFISQYMQLVTGYSPLRAGLWLVPASIGMIASTMFAPRVAQRFGQWPVIAGGMALAGVGIAVLTQAGAEGTPLLVLGGMLIATIGLGPGAALVTDIVVGSAPPERAGSAASMSETSGEFGIATGVAMLGSLGAALYRSDVDLPDGTPAEAAAAANEGLPAAVAVAKELPAELGDQVLDNAREAFTSGLNLVAGMGAAAVLIIALVLARVIKTLPAQPGGTADQGDGTDAAGAEVAADGDAGPAAQATEADARAGTQAEETDPDAEPVAVVGS